MPVYFQEGPSRFGLGWDSLNIFYKLVLVLSRFCRFFEPGQYFDYVKVLEIQRGLQRIGERKVDES